MSSFSDKAAAKFAELSASGSTSLNGVADTGISFTGTEEDWADEDDDEDLGPDTVIQTPYQLGFPEEGSNSLHSDENWKTWDGGRIGGKPVWLNPAQAPAPSDLQCPSCSDPLQFVLQIYCPLDDVPSAFHRSLYLFACKKAPCVASHPGSVICLRSQLPRMNSYYAFSPTDTTSNCADNTSMPSTTSHTNIKTSENAALAYVPSSLCIVCGCGAPYSCKACSTAKYCSKAHQRQHWKEHCKTCTGSTHNKTASGASAVALGEEVESEATAGADVCAPHYVYAEYSLDVYPEELVKDDAAAAESSAHIWDDAHTPGGEDEADDLALKQSDYNTASGNVTHDVEYLAFLKRLRRSGPDQVLRYARWQPDAGPLPISALAAKLNNTVQNPVPPCTHCGAARAFEFQVMPQLLHFLKVDAETNVNAPDVDEARRKVATGEIPTVPLHEAIKNLKAHDVDWGTLDVYTCTASCDAAVTTGAVAASTLSTELGNTHFYAKEFVRIIPGHALDR